MNTLQKEAFVKYEADSWFDRNRATLLDFDVAKDPVLRVVRDYEIIPGSCLELGASVGHRLNALRTSFPACRAVGIDPSEKAVQAGNTLFPSIEMHQGTADDLSRFADNSFDLIICGFFLYVTDRSLLLRTVAEIDRVLKNHGRVVIYDFFSVKPSRNNYSHIKDFPAWSFKQNYEDMFLASGLYHLLHKETMNHASLVKDGGNDFKNKSTVTAIIKDIDAAYE